MDLQPKSSAGTGVGDESERDDEPWCLAGESQEPDSLSDVESSVLELCASVGDDATWAGHGLPSLGKSELVGVRDLGEAEDGGVKDVLFGVDGGVRVLHKIPGGLEETEEITNFVVKEKEDSTQMNGGAGHYVPDTFDDSTPVDEDGGGRHYVPDTFDDSVPEDEDSGGREYVPDTFDDSMPVEEDSMVDSETMKKVIMPMLDIYIPAYRKIYESNKRKKLR